MSVYIPEVPETDAEVLEDAEVYEEKSKPLFIALSSEGNKIKITFYGRWWKFVMLKKIKNLQELEGVDWNTEGIVDFEVSKSFDLNILKLFL